MTTSLIYMFKEMYNSLNYVRKLETKDVIEGTKEATDRLKEEVERYRNPGKKVEDIEMKEIRRWGQSPNSRCLCHK